MEGSAGETVFSSGAPRASDVRPGHAVPRPAPLIWWHNPPPTYKLQYTTPAAAPTQLHSLQTSPARIEQLYAGAHSTYPTEQDTGGSPGPVVVVG